MPGRVRPVGFLFAGRVDARPPAIPERKLPMPYVSVRITKEGVTAAQKAQIVREMTETLGRVLGKRPEHTHVVIDLVEEENWGYAGMLTTEYRRSETS